MTKCYIRADGPFCRMSIVRSFECQAYQKRALLLLWKNGHSAKAGSTLRRWKSWIVNPYSHSWTYIFLNKSVWYVLNLKIGITGWAMRTIINCFRIYSRWLSCNINLSVLLLHQHHIRDENTIYLLKIFLFTCLALQNKASCEIVKTILSILRIIGYHKTRF